MSLDDLDDDVTDAYGDLGDELALGLDRETRNELALLLAAFDGDPEELVRRGVHALFRSTVDTGDLDFHLRQGYDVSYDEYLSGMTYDEMTGGSAGVGGLGDDDDRRYQF
ncbi:MAG: hypothetical protein ABEJ79_01870 [Halolamina sp.]